MEQRESLLNSYAESFVINKSCGVQSNALERSVNSAPTKKVVFKFSYHSSIIFMSTCWVFHAFLYAAKKGERNIFLFVKPETLFKTSHKFLISIQNTDWSENWNRMFVFRLFI